MKLRALHPGTAIADHSYGAAQLRSIGALEVIVPCGHHLYRLCVRLVVRTEIYGGTLSNFGDELMLRRITRELASRIDGFTPVVYPRDVRYGNRARLGLQHILPGFGRGPLVARAGIALIERSAPARLSRLTDLYGVVPPSAVDALVTLSGFAFSDHWAGAAMRAVKVFRYYARRGKPVVLLPQALGPFESAVAREAFQEIVQLADLIFARDSSSLEYARSAATDTTKIKRAYDITLVEQREHVPPDSRAELRVSMVPNQRMIDRGPASWRIRYVDVMCRVARALVEYGATVDIVIHDREPEDAKLASELVERVPRARLLHLHDPSAVRAHLGKASAVISSRYHALVGALALGVPALGIGWAHKYQGLFEDFGISDWCVAEHEAEEDIVQKALAICHSDTNRELRRVIDRVLPEIASENNRMWDEVSQVLTKSPYPFGLNPSRGSVACQMSERRCI